MDVFIPLKDLNMKIKKMINIVIFVSIFVYFRTNEMGEKKEQADCDQKAIIYCQLFFIK